MSTKVANSPSPLQRNPLGDVSNTPFPIGDTPHIFAHSQSSTLSELSKLTMVDAVNAAGINVSCADGIKLALAHPRAPPLTPPCIDASWPRAFASSIGF